jgi:hypothetical protein
MELPINTPTSDRRVVVSDPESRDSRVATADRRKMLRTRTLKGGRIVSPTAASIKCLIRNMSEAGAQLEVHTPVLENTFGLVFDDGKWSRRSCSVVWRGEDRIGVKFQ